MGGFSIGFLEGLFHWTTVIAAVFGSIGLISALLSAFSGYEVADRLQKELNLKVAETTTRGEEAKAESAKALERASSAEANLASANERAAQANERAAEAKLESERLKSQFAWRTLSDSVTNSLRKHLANNPGQVNIQYVANDPEAMYLAIQLSNIFGKAGWQVGLSSITLNGILIFGLWVPDNNSSFVPIIRSALQKVNIRFSSGQEPMRAVMMSSGNSIKDAPILFIGSKPIPQ